MASNRLVGKCTKKKALPLSLDERIQKAEKAEEATEKNVAKVESQLKENIRRWKEMDDGPCKERTRQQSLKILRRKKSYEQQLEAVRSRSLSLRETQHAVEQAQTLDAMREGAKALSKCIKTTPDEIESIVDEMKQTIENSNEVGDILSRQSCHLPDNLDEKELEDELLNLLDTPSDMLQINEEIEKEHTNGNTSPRQGSDERAPDHIKFDKPPLPHKPDIEEELDKSHSTEYKPQESKTMYKHGTEVAASEISEKPEEDKPAESGRQGDSTKPEVSKRSNTNDRSRKLGKQKRPQKPKQSETKAKKGDVIEKADKARDKAAKLDNRAKGSDKVEESSKPEKRNKADKDTYPDISDGEDEDETGQRKLNKPVRPPPPCIRADDPKIATNKSHDSGKTDNAVMADPPNSSNTAKKPDSNSVFLTDMNAQLEKKENGKKGECDSLKKTTTARRPAPPPPALTAKSADKGNRTKLSEIGMKNEMNNPSSSDDPFINEMEDKKVSSKKLVKPIKPSPYKRQNTKKQSNPNPSCTPDSLGCSPDTKGGAKDNKDDGDVGHDHDHDGDDHEENMIGQENKLEEHMHNESTLPNPEELNTIINTKGGAKDDKDDGDVGRDYDHDGGDDHDDRDGDDHDDRDGDDDEDHDDDHHHGDDHDEIMKRGEVNDENDTSLTTRCKNAENDQKQKQCVIQ